MAPRTSSSLSLPTNELRRSRRIAGQPPQVIAMPVPIPIPTVATSSAIPAAVPSSDAMTTGQKRKHGKACHGGSEDSSTCKTNSAKKVRREAAAEPPKHEEPPCCSICMCHPVHFQVSTIDSCDHEFCFDCIAEWSKKENSCPTCRARFTEISRVHRVKEGNQNTLQVSDRDQIEEQQPTSAQIVIWGPRYDQEWVFRIPDMPALLEQTERELFLHHIFHGAMGPAALEQPIAVDVYATSHPPPRRRVLPRRSRRNNSRPEESNDNRYQVWISSMDFGEE